MGVRWHANPVISECATRTTPADEEPNLKGKGLLSEPEMTLDSLVDAMKVSDRLAPGLGVVGCPGLMAIWRSWP